MDVEVGTVAVDGKPIGYRRAGTGPPLVLLHGAWSDSREWRRELGTLSDDFTVIAWDAPGCGPSFDPPDDFSIAAYADAVAGFVDAIGVDHPHLLGLSFGGGLALEVYHRHPALPRSLVLASAYAGWAGSLPADEVAARVRRVIEESERPPSEWAPSYLPSFFASPVPQSARDEMLEIMLDVRPAGIRPMVTAFAAADLRDVLPTITVPTLLLYGELDSRAPRAVAEELHRRIPGSELVMVPDVGHATNVEAPDAFDATVRAFLRTVTP